jgi:putative inorganic carbon (HCO3(-)) transporter
MRPHTGALAGELPWGVHTFVRRGCSLGERCLVTALFAPWALLAGRARRVFLALILLDIPLQIDKSFAHLTDAGELGAVGGFNLSLTTIALVGLYGAWLIDCLVHRYRSERVPASLVLPLATYVTIATLSLVVARDVGLHARGLVLLVQMFLLYVYLVGTIRTRQDVCFVARWLLYGLVLEGLVIGLSVVGGVFAVPGLQVRMDVFDEGVEDFGTAARFSGTLGNPNFAAGYLELLLAPALAILGTNLGRYYKALAVLGLSLGSGALIGTFSRGGWLAASVSLTIAYFLLWRRRKLSPGVPVVLLALLVSLALLFHEPIANRLTGEDLGAARSRVPMMMMARNIIADSPLLGVGANNYTEALRRRTPEFGNEWLFTVHNKYLLVWAETGTVGLLAYLWFLLAALRRGWQCWKRADPLLSPLALGFTAALVGHMLHLLVDLFNNRAQVQLLFVAAALIGVMSRMDAPRSLARTP